MPTLTIIALHCTISKNTQWGIFFRGIVIFEHLILQESFYYWTTLNFEIPLALVLQFEVYCKVDRLLTGLTAKPIGTTAQWYLNKTPLDAI